MRTVPSSGLPPTLPGISKVSVAEPSLPMLPAFTVTASELSEGSGFTTWFAISSEVKLARSLGKSCANTLIVSPTLALLGEIRMDGSSLKSSTSVPALRPSPSTMHR